MTQQISTQRDRIYIDASNHPIYEDLTTEKEGSVQPFKSMKDLFLLAVFIGYRRGQRSPLKTRRGIFAWAQFTPQEDVPVLQALAIAETGNVSVLANQEELLKIAEEYANSGIVEIQEQVAGMPGNRIGNLADLLRQWMAVGASP